MKKLAIIDHPDWLRLRSQERVSEVLDTGKCALAMHKHPATAHWKPALLTFTALVPIGVIAGILLLFWKWWLGLILIGFSLVPLRRGIADSIHREVIRVAKEDPSFFSCAIATGGLRFLVDEADLDGIAHLDGQMHVPHFMPPAV